MPNLYEMKREFRITKDSFGFVSLWITENETKTLCATFMTNEQAHELLKLLAEKLDVYIP